MADFEAESEHLLLDDPALACARAGVLHYFAQRNRAVDPGHLIFRFHQSDTVRRGEGDLQSGRVKDSGSRSDTARRGG